MTNLMDLILDASAKKTLVAYGDSAKIVASREWVAGIKLSKELLPAIERILARRPKPRAVFCVTGPGSFTGLRIAVSTANALGYAWRLPVVPIEAFEIYEAAQLNLQPPYEVVLDNIRDLVYLKRVWRGKREYAVERVEEVKNQKSKVKSQELFGYVSKEKQNILGAGNKRLLVIGLSGKQRAKLIIQIGQEKRKQSHVFARPIIPLYINAPHITVKK